MRCVCVYTYTQAWAALPNFLHGIQTQNIMLLWWAQWLSYLSTWKLLKTLGDSNGQLRLSLTDTTHSSWSWEDQDTKGKKLSGRRSRQLTEPKGLWAGSSDSSPSDFPFKGLEATEKNLCSTFLGLSRAVSSGIFLSKYNFWNEENKISSLPSPRAVRSFSRRKPEPWLSV